MRIWAKKTNFWLSILTVIGLVFVAGWHLAAGAYMIAGIATAMAAAGLFAARLEWHGLKQSECSVDSEARDR